MKNRKSLIALLLVAIVGIVGLTIAYFANSTSVDNTFITKEYGTTYEETFVSPDNWLPGDTTEKTLVATNTGEVDQAVRVLVTESWTTNNNGTLNGWIHSDGTKSTHTTQSELETDERVAVLNLANTSDWTKVGNYYYYNYQLAPTESTTSLLESVTFNSKTKLDDTCTTTTNNGVTTTTCNSSGDDYDNATYTLTLTIETVQYNKYNEAWNLNNVVTIAAEKPVADPYSMASMCPGCVYLSSQHSAYDESLEEVTSPEIGKNIDDVSFTPALANDYTTLGGSFYGIVIENNVITRGFACGYNDNNQVFCLEGGIDEYESEDKSTYERNFDIIKHFYPNPDFFYSTNYNDINDYNIFEPYDSDGDGIDDSYEYNYFINCGDTSTNVFIDTYGSSYVYVSGNDSVCVNYDGGGFYTNGDCSH